MGEMRRSVLCTRSQEEHADDSVTTGECHHTLQHTVLVLDIDVHPCLPARLHKQLCRH